MEIAGLIISIVSVLIAIGSIVISVVHNRKLHDENRMLASEPSLSVDLLFDSKIGGQIVKKEYAVDTFNVWESKYTPLYVENEIFYCDNPKAYFTIVVANNGNAVATDICITEILALTKTGNKIFSDRKVLFESCSQGEKKANKIHLELGNETVETVELTIEYKNLLNQKKTVKYYYKVDGSKAMLGYVKNEKIG